MLTAKTFTADQLKSITNLPAPQETKLQAMGVYARLAYKARILGTDIMKNSYANPMFNELKRSDLEMRLENFNLVVRKELLESDTVSRRERETVLRNTYYALDVATIAVKSGQNDEAVRKLSQLAQYYTTVPSQPKQPY